MRENAVETLGRVASEATEIWCLCDLERPAGTVQLKLMSRGNQKRIEASACIQDGAAYRTEKEDVSSLNDGIAALAAKWKGTLNPSSLKFGAKKSPVRGGDLETLLLSALSEAFHGTVPVEYQECFDRVVEKLRNGVAKKTPRKSVPKKAPAPICMPDAFDADDESNKFLQRAKKRAAKDFKWTKTSSVRDASELAFWLHLFERDDEATEVAQFLEQFEFTGDYTIWSYVEGALALLARYERVNGKKGRHKALVKRIRDTGFVDARLEEGNLLAMYEDRVSQVLGDKTSERNERVILIGELCTLRELGGSRRLPTDELEQRYTESYERLRELIGAS